MAPAPLTKPHARLQPAPARAAKPEAAFWKVRQDFAVETSIPALHELPEEHGILHN